MTESPQELLGVWREACRHIEIDESAAAIAPILRRRLVLDQLVLLRIDPTGRSIETVSAAPAHETAFLPSLFARELSTEAIRTLAAWAHQGAILRSPNAATRPEVARLIAGGLAGDLWILPLAGTPESIGVAVLAAFRDDAFSADDAAFVASLRDPLATALDNDRRVRELSTLREAAEADRRTLLERLGRGEGSEPIIGADAGLRPVMERVELVARSDAPVLILGETGSGKEVIARAIHTSSQRGSGPFLRVNCGAIPAELIDSELFGHERGSFTGAVGTRKGWFERADGGTLFLDEIGELPPAAQVRLLRILQDGVFERVGGQHSLHVDVRIVAATHRDLGAMVGDGRFREDLWYRIAVFPIRLPALRERTTDIPALALHFAQRASRRFGLHPQTPSEEDLRLLAAYPWPGNVRELAAVIDRAALLGEGKRLDVSTALGPILSPPPSRPSAPSAAAGDAPFPTLDDAIVAHIEEALKRTAGRIEGPRGAAALLGINPHTLRARMRKLRLDWARYRTS